MTAPIDVGILGATGVVGQQFVARLARHPWFRPTWLAASERSEGKRYQAIAPWRLAHPIPESLAPMLVEACTPGRGPRVVFSALDASVAGEIEQAFAAAGHFVVSNARNYRMDPLVPLLIPEINADHLAIVAEQQKQKGWKGAIVTHPNCSTVVLAMALAPLRTFGLEAAVVTTLQAISGAGYPGVPSFDILGNVIPGIAGEEEKIESETSKILGPLSNGGVEAHPVVVSAHTNRVPVIDGHTLTASVRLRDRPSPAAVADAMRAWRGRPQELKLHSAPDRPIEVEDDGFRPQPRLDVERGHGMAITAGRIRGCPIMGTKFVAMGHNTIRGAAGAAILNAELMLADGWLEDV